MRTKRIPRTRGVSLIEALVALAVMAFGMLAVVGVQATLRANSDLSKQRAEAVRIAQQAIEMIRYRDYDDYDELAADILDAAPPSNTTFGLAIAVSEDIAPSLARTISAEVSWTDRIGRTEGVRLATQKAIVPPELAGSLSLPADQSTISRPLGRHPEIPVQALNFGDGTSGLKPPGAPDTVAWRFDNLTGLITLCSVDPAEAAYTSALTTANLNCGTENALFLSGFVRYALTTTQPEESDARSPGSDPIPSLSVSITRSDGGLTPICYSLPVTTPSKFTIYNCAVPVTITEAVPVPTWSGAVSFAVDPDSAMATVLTENSAAKFKVCSYAHPRVLTGAAAFTGGGSALVMSRLGGGAFRDWSERDRINLLYEGGFYAYTVAADVEAPDPPATTQTVSVREVLPGTAGAALSGAAYRDDWPYTNIAGPLANQNYLVIRAGNAPAALPATDAPFTCPMSTVPHQPTY